MRPSYEMGPICQANVYSVSCSFQKRTTSRFVVSKSGQAILAECLRGTGGRCPPDPLGYIALELETAGACQPDQARVGPLFTEVWWRRGQPLTNRPLRWVSTTCVERPCRTCESSAFARPSGFANYKLSAFANYSRPLLLAPRHPYVLGGLGGKTGRAITLAPTRRRKCLGIQSHPKPLQSHIIGIYWAYTPEYKATLKPHQGHTKAC